MVNIIISNTRPPAWYVGKLPNNQGINWGLTETGAQTNQVAVTCMTTHTVAYVIANVSEARPLPVVVSFLGWPGNEGKYLAQRY